MLQQVDVLKSNFLSDAFEWLSDTEGGGVSEWRVLLGELLKKPAGLPSTESATAGVADVVFASLWGNGRNIFCAAQSFIRSAKSPQSGRLSQDIVLIVKKRRAYFKEQLLRNNCASSALSLSPRTELRWTDGREEIFPASEREP